MKLSHGKAILILTMAFSIATGAIKGQESIDANVVREYADSYRQKFPVEKAYLQLDKSFYVPGETVWMKAYVVKNTDYELSDISGVLYVDLIDQANKILDHNILYVANGEAVGDFELGDNLRPGEYRIRAYTKWMQNFDRMFETSMTILGNGVFSSERSRTDLKPDIQFLPEGGKLISGLKQTVAFKAIAPSGLGIDVKGKIVDGEGKEVIAFATTHNGMGEIAFIPLAGKTYIAQVEYDSETYVYPFPEVNDSGWNLSVNSYMRNFEVRIRAKNVENESYLLTGTVRNEVLYTKRGTFSEEEDIYIIPKSDFPTGVVAFTLHANDGIPLCERLTFNNQNDDLRVFLTTNKSTYSQRDKVEVEITAADAKGNPVMAPFSIAVTHTDGFWDEQPDRETIMSHLYLSSDVRGFVENAPLYFQDNGYNAEELDLVMLTHGWRGFEWETVLSEKLPTPEYYMEQGLSISGKVYEERSGETLDEGKITLVVDNVYNTFVTHADDEGRFSFMNLAFLDTTQLFLQARTSRNKKREMIFELDKTDTLKVNPYIRIGGYFQEAITQDTRTEYISSSTQYIRQQDMLEGIAQYELGTVQIVAQAPEEEEDRNQLYSRADYTVKGDDLPQNLTVLDALQGRVPGVNIYGGLGNPRVSIRGAYRGQPLFLLDGIPTDVSMIQSIPMFDVDRIDILKGPSSAIYGGRGGNGVIAIYTKRGYESDGGGVPDEDQPGIIRPDLPGFHVARIFYAPQYEADESEYQAPDLRSTIYWNPVVRTDKNGKAKLRFFNSDLRGEYQITLEGISLDGKLGRATEIYEVN